MVFTKAGNQYKIINLMDMVDDMHRNGNITLGDADRVELAVAFMIRRLLSNNGDNVSMSYATANALCRLNSAPVHQITVRLRPSDMVYTRISLADGPVFIAVYPDGTIEKSPDFRTFLDSQFKGISYTDYEYIEHLFSLGWRRIDIYRQAQTWSKNIISNCWRGYYGDHDFIFTKLEPAVTKFIESMHDQVSLDNILSLVHEVYYLEHLD